jgi:asparagine synthase (glutamine-hydrolysing)
MGATPAVAIEGLASKWHDAIERCIDGLSSVNVLYSGGLDSSVVAYSAKDVSDVRLVTVGTKDSSDLVAAERGSRVLDLPWVSRIIDRKDVEHVLQSDRDTLKDASAASRGVLVGLALALEATSESRVLCGQGADELFLGYAHFEGLSPIESLRRREEDLGRLLKDDWPRSVAMAERQGKELRSPFLEPEFLDQARELSIDQLRSGVGRKSLLRQVALTLGVPAELVTRPKKAFQYGSGIDRLLKSRFQVA